ncbi:vitamin K epoxide reductase family protein [Allostreptomyces psammosilenae]|uniref:Putative membrane protein n=1 Tax=Allostreptomyces psammosilenae TaxID=1892865 RepID=A0A852ZSE6_9ACTN|nr:vitamin K epoxide reductase family protein [Allostreptomyces psammosilenae]NYI03754.1 putative membrane protein [Allostreptomyces psammosilenae]
MSAPTSPALTSPAAVAPTASRPRHGAPRALALTLVVAGLIGLAASVALLLEKIELLQDPDYVPSCSINPIISCGSVMVTPQAEAFGFPNPVLGVAAFAIVTTVGMALLAGAVFARWFWWGLQAGTVFGVVFVHWLISQSLYEIGALCPYCMVVWAVTIALFWQVTTYNLREGGIALPGRAGGWAVAVSRSPWLVIGCWYLVIAMLILNRFWFYWRTLI